MNYHVIYCKRKAGEQAQRHLIGRLYENDTVEIPALADLVEKDFITGSENFYRISGRTAMGAKAKHQGRLMMEPDEDGLRSGEVAYDGMARWGTRLNAPVRIQCRCNTMRAIPRYKDWDPSRG